MSSRSYSANVAIKLSVSLPSRVDGSMPSDGNLRNEVITELGVTGVDVNEQISGVCGFYLSRGFTQVRRYELDGDGRPYPILHLELSR